VTEENAGTARAERGRGLDIVALLHREHLAAHHPSIDDPAGGRQAHDDVPEPQPHDGVDGEGEKDEGEGELHVAETHQRLTGPAAEEPGEKAEETAHDGGE
jgi:hypothetical protein